MNWEAATFALTAIVLVLQGIAVYTTSQIKVWSLEKFVSKKDFLETLHLWSRKEHGRDA